MRQTLTLQAPQPLIPNALKPATLKPETLNTKSLKPMNPQERLQYQTFVHVQYVVTYHGPGGML